MAMSPLCSQVVSLLCCSILNTGYTGKERNKVYYKRSPNGIIHLINELGSISQNRTVCT